MRRRTKNTWEKFQITIFKSQINTKYQIQNGFVLVIWLLVFGYYLIFGAWYLEFI